MLSTPFTQTFGIQHPIIQAGMNLAGPELAAAVSNAGALGTIGTIGKSPRQVAEEVERTRQLTSHPFAVNIVTFEWAPFAFELATAAIQAGAPIITASFGEPTRVAAQARDARVKVIIQVQHLEGAREAIAARPDLLIVQGNEAGGHTGMRGTLSFGAQVLDMAGDIPVAVAGGIASGRGLAAVLAMGAAAAVCGTRFKATAEYPDADYIKQQVIASDGSNTTDDEINDVAYGMRWPEGVVGRAIRNDFQHEWQGRTDELRTLVAGQQPHEFVGSLAQRNASVNWAGEASGLVDRIEPAAVVVARMVEEAEALLHRWARTTAVTP